MRKLTENWQPYNVSPCFAYIFLWQTENLRSCSKTAYQVSVLFRPRRHRGNVESSYNALCFECEKWPWPWDYRPHCPSSSNASFIQQNYGECEEFWPVRRPGVFHHLSKMFARFPADVCDSQCGGYNVTQALRCHLIWKCWHRGSSPLSEDMEPDCSPLQSPCLSEEPIAIIESPRQLTKSIMPRVTGPIYRE